MSLSRFDEAFFWIIQAEGGFVDDANDRGGTTKFGISKRAYPDLDIAALTMDNAKAIYKRDYWDRAHCDEVPIGIDLLLFDAAVHHGPKRAIKMLQRVLRVKVDGIFGPITKGAVWAAKKRWVIRQLLAQRATFMHDIVVADSSQSKFLPGWYGRLFDLRARV